MLVKKANLRKLRGEDVPGSEITPHSAFVNRRTLMKQGLSLGALSLSGLSLPVLAGLQPDDALTPEDIVTSYNNFYEFGTSKSDPAEYAHTLTTSPWSVKVSGAANNTGEFDFTDVI
ncbi:MAG: mononuclear molybdenum enzyme YedY, partial [Pseudomonadota bacterium]